MLKLIKFIALFLILTSFTNETPGSPITPSEPVTIILEKKTSTDLKEPTNRPRMPQPVIIAKYFDGKLSLSYVSNVELKIVINSNNTVIFNGIIMPDQCIYIGELTEFSVTCILPNNETFYGEYNNP